MVVTCLDEAGKWRPATLRVVTGKSGGEDQLALEYLDSVAGATPLSTGVVTGGFTDWHVHLHLIDWAALTGSPITRVHDLGGNPNELQRIAVRGMVDPSPDNATNTSVKPASTSANSFKTNEATGSLDLEVLHAGAFLTPPGGYPSDRTWAPASSYREVSDSSDASAAVREMAEAGASAIKIASNSEAGPVFSDDVFAAIVAAAQAVGLPAVTHAEGRGEALRAARLGTSRLAHAPFSEFLTESEITELAARTSWCSTLDIHGWGDYGRAHEIAVANVAAFVRQGGRLLYGTDMGNGPTPIGLNPRELASLASAGLTPEQQLATLTPGDPRTPNAPLLWIPRDKHGQLDVASASHLAATNLATLVA